MLLSLLHDCLVYDLWAKVRRILEDTRKQLLKIWLRIRKYELNFVSLGTRIK